MMRQQHASILILSLWTLCLLSGFAVCLGFATRQKIVLTGRLNNRDNLHYIAEAGIRQAMLGLNKDASPAYDTLGEMEGINKNILRDVRVGQGKFRASIADEERKININRAGQSMLRRLFVASGMDQMEAQNLAASIIDWRDKDSELSIPLGSAETHYYENLSEPYKAKDGDFERLEEVLLVKDVTQGIFDRIKDFITIYGDGRVNINTASAEVLCGLGLGDMLISQIINYRDGQDDIIGTTDDGVFTEPQAVVAQLNQFVRLSDSEAAQLSDLISNGYISTVSNYFMVESAASFNETDGHKQKIVSIVDRAGRILSYTEF